MPPPGVRNSGIPSRPQRAHRGGASAAEPRAISSDTRCPAAGGAPCRSMPGPAAAAAASTGQLGQDPDPRIRPGALADLGAGPADRDLQRVDHGQVVLDHLPRHRRERQRGEPAPAGPAPAPGRPVLTVISQDRADPVPQQRPQPHQLRPVPQQRPQLPHRRRRDPRLRQQVRTQQLREDRGVDFVVLQPGRGDRLALQRMHQVRVEAVVLEQPDQPPPTVSGLGRCGRARRQAADHAQDRLHPVRHVPVGEYLATRVDDCHLRALAVDVDPDVDRHCRPPFRARLSPGASRCRAEQERGSGLTPGPP